MSNSAPRYFADHRRALEVPARAAAAPRRRPGRRLGLARLVALPQREVARVALAARVGVLGRLHVVDPLVGQLAVRRPGPHVEVDVARAVRRRRRRARARSASVDQLDHLGDVPGGARLVRRRQRSRARRTPRAARARWRRRAPTTGGPASADLARILSSMSVTLRDERDLVAASAPASAAGRRRRPPCGCARCAARPAR